MLPSILSVMPQGGSCTSIGLKLWKLFRESEVLNCKTTVDFNTFYRLCTWYLVLATLWQSRSSLA